MVKGKKYLVKWRDHFSTEGWFDLEDLAVEEEVLFETVGFFVKENPFYYYFAQHMSHDTCGDIMSILQNDIIEIKEI